MSDIYTALAAVMADCTSVAKRDRNEHQRFLFRGIDAVVNAVGPILRKHGVIVVPVVRDVHYDVVQTTTGKPATACRILADYVFSAPDGSNITATVAGEAWDSGDKAAPKAMSIAFRTALLQALALPTDDPEPDAQTYERDAPRHRAAPAEQPGPTPVRTMSRKPAEDRAPVPVTREQVTKIMAQMGDLGITGRDERLARVIAIIGREIESSNDLTKAEASQVIGQLDLELIGGP